MGVMVKMEGMGRFRICLRCSLRTWLWLEIGFGFKVSISFLFRFRVIVICG